MGTWAAKSIEGKIADLERRVKSIEESRSGIILGLIFALCIVIFLIVGHLNA